MIAASVVDLPDPVGPVTRTNPCGRLAKCSIAGGAPSWSSVGSVKGMTRNDIEIAPIWKKQLARKRATPFHENAKSTSLFVRSSCFSSSVSTDSTRCSQ